MHGQTFRRKKFGSWLIQATIVVSLTIHSVPAMADDDEEMTAIIIGGVAIGCILGVVLGTVLGEELWGGPMFMTDASPDIDDLGDAPRWTFDFFGSDLSSQPSLPMDLDIWGPTVDEGGEFDRRTRDGLDE